MAGKINKKIINLSAFWEQESSHKQNLREIKINKKPALNPFSHADSSGGRDEAEIPFQNGEEI